MLLTTFCIGDTNSIANDTKIRVGGGIFCLSGDKLDMSVSGGSVDTSHGAIVSMSSNGMLDTGAGFAITLPRGNDTLRCGSPMGISCSVCSYKVVEILPVITLRLSKSGPLLL